MVAFEETLVMLKPDAFVRCKVGTIISKIESKGFRIKSIRSVYATENRVRDHYKVHSDKPFFEDLVASIVGSNVIIMVVTGPSAIEDMRRMIGAGEYYGPGTIRWDHSYGNQNLVHASDSKESFIYERSVWFSSRN